MRIEHDTAPLPDIPSGPPDYLGAETCAECWEPFIPRLIARWLALRFQVS